MNKKLFAIIASVLALSACGDKTPDPEMLKGASFISAAEGTDITLMFDATDMKVNGQVVNLYHGTYEANGDKIKFGPMASTMMLGPTNAMQTEQDYFQFLTTVETYDLQDGRLTLMNAEGKEIVFQQVEAPATETVDEVETVEVLGVEEPVALQD